MCRPDRLARGFTLVELLVVIAIIGVLMGLLLPAVNAAREAGRRAACVNNQFQQAFAMIQFNNAQNYIPGWRNRISGTAPNAPPGFYSWPVAILPGMERKDVYNKIVENPSGTPPSTYIAFFVCPSSPPDALTSPWLHYVANVGTGTTSTAPGRASGVVLDVTGTDSATGRPFPRVSLDDVANNDGTAMTLLVSEKCGSGTSSLAPLPMSWNVGNANLTSSFSFTNAATSIPAFGISGTPTSGLKVINNKTAVGPPGFSSQPSSNHPGGAVVAFCDGHTGFLKDTLQVRVYAQLLGWNDAIADDAAPFSGWAPAGSAPLSESDFQ